MRRRGSRPKAMTRLAAMARAHSNIAARVRYSHLALAGCGSGDDGTIPPTEAERAARACSTAIESDVDDGRLRAGSPGQAEEFADRGQRACRRRSTPRSSSELERGQRRNLDELADRAGRVRRGRDRRHRESGRADDPTTTEDGADDDHDRGGRADHATEEERADDDREPERQPGPERRGPDPAQRRPGPARLERRRYRRRRAAERRRRSRRGRADEHHDLRPLRARRPPRLGRHVDRLPGDRPRARAHGRGQDPRRAPLRRRQVRRPLPPRGARGREADPPQHRPGLRHRRRRRPPLHRHGVRRGQVGRPAAADEGPARRRGRRSRSASSPAPGSSTPTARGSSTATSSPGT